MRSKSKKKSPQKGKQTEKATVSRLQNGDSDQIIPKQLSGAKSSRTRTVKDDDRLVKLSEAIETSDNDVSEKRDYPSTNISAPLSSGLQTTTSPEDCHILSISRSSRSSSTSPEHDPYVESALSRVSKRERSPSPERIGQIVDLARIHPNKALIQELTSIPAPTCSKLEDLDQTLAEFRDTIIKTVKRHHISKTGWELLHQEWQAIEPREIAAKNTEYKNTRVDLDDLRFWTDFPTVEDIYEFSRSTPLLRRNFHECELPTITGDRPWYERWFDEAPSIGCSAEVIVVERMSVFFSWLNALIRLTNFERGKRNSWVTIDGGKLAMERRSEGKSGRKDPDRVAFWTDGKHPRRHGKESGDLLFPATEIPCLLVGDYKMAGKFNWQMLQRAYEGDQQAEPQKVLNQIHDYMDMHHNRFGYIITEVELIMFRRREEGNKWGQLDFSPSIPIQPEQGRLNALMVLWYFHAKYAMYNEDMGHRLQSLYFNCPKSLLGDSNTASPSPKTARGSKRNTKEVSGLGKLMKMAFWS